MDHSNATCCSGHSNRSVLDSLVMGEMGLSREEDHRSFSLAFVELYIIPQKFERGRLAAFVFFRSREERSGAIASVRNHRPVIQGCDKSSSPLTAMQIH